MSRSRVDYSLAPTLVVSDIDGTLVPLQGAVSAKTSQALQTVSDHDVPIILATGRPLRWIPEVIAQIPVDPYLACDNGAVVFDSNTGKVLDSHTLAPAPLGRITENFAKAFRDAQGAGAVAPEARVHIGMERLPAFSEDPNFRLDIHNPVFPDTKDFSVSPGFVHAWDSDTYEVQPLDELVSTPALKMMIRVPSVPSSTLFEIARSVIDPDDASVTYSYDDGLLEIAAPSVTKRTGIEYLMRHFHLDDSRSLAFGDMPNDLTMLTWAHTGVAMGSAPEIVKDAAQTVTSSVEDDGVAEVLTSFFG